MQDEITEFPPEFRDNPAMLAAFMLGQELGTVGRKIRPALIAQIRNKALMLEREGMHEAAKFLNVVVNSWEIRILVLAGKI